MTELRRYRMLSNDHLEIQDDNGNYEQYYSQKFAVENGVDLDYKRNWEIKNRKYFKLLKVDLNDD